MQLPQFNGDPLSVYNRLTQTDPPTHLGHYNYRQVPLRGDPETIKTLTAEGFKQITGKDNRARGLTLAYLFAHLYDVVFVQDGEKLTYWTHRESLSHVTKYPVLLCFTLDELSPDKEHIQMLQLLPHPRHGEFAVIESHGSALYSIRDLGEKGEVLRAKLENTVRDLAGNSTWQVYRPEHTSCATELSYTALSTQLLSEIVATHDAARTERKERFRKLEEAHNHVVALRQSWLRPDWLAKWIEIRRMAVELAAAYYTHHLARLQQNITKRDLPTISDAFIDNRASIWTALPFQAFPEAMSNAASGALRWKGEQTGENSYRVTYRKETKLGITSIHLDATKEKNAAIAQERVWQMVKEMSDLDGDVYIAFIAQLVNSRHTRNKDGYTWITATNILNYRGIKPKTERTVSGKVYSAGHRYEDLEKIADAVWRMKNIRVTVDQTIYEEPSPSSKRGKGKPKTYRYKRESPLLVFIDSITRQELWTYADGGHPTMEIAWQIKESPWMELFIAGTNRMEGTILQMCLEYDPHNEKWEKRISKYLMVHLLMNKHSSSITRNIGAILEELSLSEEINTRDPMRTKDRFEKALNRLKADGHISGWRYKEKRELPARKWLGTWLAEDIVFTAPIIVDGNTAPKALTSEK
jgi:hypothetical protein